MKKKIIIIGISITTVVILLGVLAFVFIFGGKKNEPVNDTSSYKEPIGTDSGVNLQISTTTGLQFEDEYKPVMSVIENSPSARPQLGLQTADVVYEVPVEGAITRFVCVFSDNVPDSIMPVRSGRAPFLYIQAEWDAIFMHFGGSGSGSSSAAEYTFYGNSLHDKIKIDLEGLVSYHDGIFKRVNTAKAPHNVMGNPLLAQKLYNYTPAPLDWKFSSTVYYPGDSVTKIDLPLTTSTKNFVSYVYDFDEGVYFRSMSGVPFMSAETKEQLKVKNVIVQYTSYTVKSSILKDWKMVGSGSADFYIGGMYVKGTWSKATPTAQTMFLDAEGNPIVLKPGNTWIHISSVK
ncbi:MAG: DUF3048 domain-containing protein [Firmicutes bacterium]|nr:DUF3048 domain-containing protein [Bacillota bacterium]